MSRIWNLDCDEGDECDINIYLPGPPGPPLIDVGKFTAPIDISGGAIPQPVARFQRTFISAVSHSVTQPTIPNPPDNGPWLLGLQVVGGNPILLATAGNIKLSGDWPAVADSILWLLWDENSRWLEDHRNEIF